MLVGRGVGFGGTAIDLGTWKLGNTKTPTLTEFTLPDAAGEAIHVNPGQNRLYYMSSFLDTLYQYDYTGEDIFTSVLGSTFSTGLTAVTGMMLMDDEATIYLTDFPTNTVYKANVGTPGDLSTAVYSPNSLNLGSVFTGAVSSYVTNDETIIFVAQYDFAGSNVYRFDMSTPGDLSTATYSGVMSSFINTTAIQGMTFKPDGSIIYLSAVGPRIRQYDMAVPFDIVNNVPDNTNFLDIMDKAHSVRWAPDGSRLFYLRGAPDRAAQIDVGI